MYIVTRSGKMAMDIIRVWSRKLKYSPAAISKILYTFVLRADVCAPLSAQMWCKLLHVIQKYTEKI